MAMPDIEPFVPGEYTEFDRKYWSALSITLGELMDAEVVTQEWFVTFDAFSAEQAEMLWNKFVGRFQFREIGILPPGRWKLRVIAKLNEIMPKYKPLYQAIADGITTITDGDEWHKSRDVFSSFPQTALGGANEDYASTGTDREYETVRNYGLLDVGERIGTYNDVDAMILNELEPLFMVIRSTSIPWM
jgi:hypothetical protein